MPPPPAGPPFYRDVLHRLRDAAVPFMVGGAYALNRYAKVERDTKDLDLFLRREHLPAAEAALAAAGYTVQLTHPHWLAKVRADGLFVDLIFSSGNGVSPVDDDWFAHARPGTAHGVPVLICPAEEMLWTKAFIMERERFDGADVAHLLLACAGSLDWSRLLERFGDAWRVLFAHLLLFGFAYPSRRNDVPGWVLQRLQRRLEAERQQPPPAGRLCAGTLLSREQYLGDIERDGYADARKRPLGNMSADEIADWTAGIAGREPPPEG